MHRYFDSLVWIDSHEAKVVQVSAAAAAKIVLHADGVPGTGKNGYFRRIAGTIQFTDGTFIVGPGRIKFELKNYLDLHDPEIAGRISRVETIAEVRDDELMVLARNYFGNRGRRLASQSLAL